MVTLVEDEITDPSESLKAQMEEFGWIQKIYAIYNDRQVLFEENIKSRLPNDLHAQLLSPAVADKK
jgi:hypothetical protein